MSKMTQAEQLQRQRQLQRLQRQQELPEHMQEMKTELNKHVRPRVERFKPYDDNNDHVVPPSIGIDPLRKYINDPKEKYDSGKFRHLLIVPNVYDKNFNPVMSILASSKWGVYDKACALQQVLEFGADPNAVQVVPGKAFERPLFRALSLIGDSPEEGDHLLLSTLLLNGANPNHLAHNGVDLGCLIINRNRFDLLSVLASSSYKPQPNLDGQTIYDGVKLKFEEDYTKNPAKACSSLTQFINVARSSSWLNQDELSSFIDRFENANDKPLSKYLDALKEANQKMVLGKQPFLDNEIVKVTNPEKGSRHDVIYRMAHPWDSMLMLGLSDPLDRYFDGLVRQGRLEDSLAAVQYFMNNPAKLTDPNDRTLKNIIKFDYMYDLDVVPSENNPDGDSLIHHLIKNKQWDSFMKLVELDVNLNAQNSKGEGVLHLIAQYADNKEDIARYMQAIIGRRVDDKNRESIWPHGHKGSMFADSHGRSAMDIIQARFGAQSPELKYLENAVGYYAKVVEPMSDVVYTPTPDILTIGFNIEELPVLRSTATPMERELYFEKLGHYIVDAEHKIVDPQYSVYRDKLEQNRDYAIKQIADPEARLIVLLDMIAHHDSSNPALEKSMVRIMSDMVQSMKNDSAYANNVFSTFNNMAIKNENFSNPSKNMGLLPNYMLQHGILSGDKDMERVGNDLTSKLLELGGAYYANPGQDAEESKEPKKP